MNIAFHFLVRRAAFIFEEISIVHFAIHDVRWRGRAHKKGSVVSIPFQFPCERELYLVLGTNPGPGSAVRQRKSRNSPTVYAAVEWLFDELDFFCHPRMRFNILGGRGVL